MINVLAAQARSRQNKIDLREVIFGSCVTKIPDECPMKQNVRLISLIIDRTLSSRVCCMEVEITVNLDFSLSENYGYVDNFENVERIIRDHE